jgi:hypothetical protein
MHPKFVYSFSKIREVTLTDKSGFSPSAPTVQLGHSLARESLLIDTNTAADWIDNPAPTPDR